MEDRKRINPRRYTEADLRRERQRGQQEGREEGLRQGLFALGRGLCRGLGEVLLRASKPATPAQADKCSEGCPAIFFGAQHHSPNCPRRPDPASALGRLGQPPPGRC